MCPVNVHWHLGAEHTSYGEYTVEHSAGGKNGPSTAKYDARQPAGRKLLAASGGTTYLGGRCTKYDSLTADQKKDYDWKYCKNMVVGETYEVHWPHSAAGDCGTKWQYQTPFYDGAWPGWPS